MQINFTWALSESDKEINSRGVSNRIILDCDNALKGVTSQPASSLDDIM